MTKLTATDTLLQLRDEFKDRIEATNLRPSDNKELVTLIETRIRELGYKDMIELNHYASIEHGRKGLRGVKTNANK